MLNPKTANTPHHKFTHNSDKNCPSTTAHQSKMSSGWVGPGAKTSPQNQQDLANYSAIKEGVEAEKKEKREAENVRRVSMGEEPCTSCIPRGWCKLIRAFQSERWCLEKVQGLADQ